jgi:threonine dehydratase
VLSAPRAELAAGLVTASMGNMAQGVAWMARELGVPCTTVVPGEAAGTKLAAVERMGGRIVRVSRDEWWAAMEAGRAEGVDGFFVHPVRDEAVMAGNGTIGLELVEQLDRIDAVLIPWGGGGLTTGIASALRALSPATEVYVCEPETGAPVSAAVANSGVPTPVEFTPSFVDGAGAGSLLPEMWERARPLIAGAFAISIEAAAEAVRLLVERARVVAEGAGALPVAGALAGRAGPGRIVCIVSGGNIDATRLAAILEGRVPD